MEPIWRLAQFGCFGVEGDRGGVVADEASFISKLEWFSHAKFHFTHGLWEVIKAHTQCNNTVILDFRGMILLTM